jgi:hypothetical protein
MEYKKDGVVGTVNYYNMNYMDEAIKLFLSDRSITDVGRGKYGINLNIGDNNIDFITSKSSIKVKSDVTVTYGKNKWSLKKGMELSPFDIYSLVQHKGNELTALHYLAKRILKKEPGYIRVGTDFFKKSLETDRDGIDRVVLKKWTKDTIKDDYGNGLLEIIPKYVGFGIYPDNKNYKESVNGMYNHYAKFSHKAAESFNDESIKWSLHLVKHIWGDQWELGLVYLQCLYLYPKQILPILALVSKERETGKSTLGDWFNVIFGDNTCVINPANIGSDFNSSYATKNIVMIEETRFEKSGDLEKIKAIATQKKMTINPKFVAEYQIPFYGKVVMFSNHEDQFVRIDEEENRYWVLKIPTLKGKANHNILEDLTNEVPAFLAMLESMPIPDFTISRMVFTQEQINTNILQQTKKNSRSGLYKDIEIYLNQEMMENTGSEFLYFRHEGLYRKYFSRNSQTPINYVKSVLKDQMCLKMDEKTYDPLIGEETIRNNQVRCYKITNNHWVGLDSESELQEVLEEDQVPF